MMRVGIGSAVLINVAMLVAVAALGVSDGPGVAELGGIEVAGKVGLGVTPPALTSAVGSPILAIRARLNDANTTDTARTRCLLVFMSIQILSRDSR
jgi:hypothetical protein